MKTGILLAIIGALFAMLQDAVSSSSFYAELHPAIRLSCITLALILFAVFFVQLCRLQANGPLGRFGLIALLGYAVAIIRNLVWVWLWCFHSTKDMNFHFYKLDETSFIQLYMSMYDYIRWVFPICLCIFFVCLCSRWHRLVSVVKIAVISGSLSALGCLIPFSTSIYILTMLQKRLAMSDGAIAYLLAGWSIFIDGLLLIFFIILYRQVLKTGNNDISLVLGGSPSGVISGPKTSSIFSHAYSARATYQTNNNKTS